MSKTMINSSHESKKTTKVLLFPWLGHGHLSPFLELAKQLSEKTVLDVYLCSTPANLASVDKCGSPSVRFIDLNLPVLPDLPANLHTTNGLPVHLMPILKKAFDLSIPQFSKILIDLKPDLLIYDIIQPWAPVAAAAFGIPSVVFITTSAAAAMYHQYLNLADKGVEFPFPSTIYYRSYEDGHESKRPKELEKEKDCVVKCVNKSKSIVLVKSFKEIEGKYADYLQRLTNKKVVSVGPLVADLPADVTDMKQNEVIQWLDSKTTGSTVFVSFGSEYFLSNVDMKEIAYGLEMSNVNFIWVIRFPKGEVKSLESSLPFGFVKRVKDRGLVVEGWAPQAQILGHKNIGGFVTHCGWSSLLEAMKFGVPIIAMPMHLDQPINARLAVEVGVGVEVVREDNGRLKRETMAEVVKHVVVSKSGEGVREKAKKLSADLKVKGDEEMVVAADELMKLCRTGGSLHVVSNGPMQMELRKTKSDAFPIGAHCALKGQV